MQLTSQDLTMVIQIIDASAEKGVFKGPDLTSVGALRQRFVDVIKQSQAQAQEGQTNEPASK